MSATTLSPTTTEEEVLDQSSAPQSSSIRRRGKIFFSNVCESTHVRMLKTFNDLSPPMRAIARGALAGSIVRDTKQAVQIMDHAIIIKVCIASDVPHASDSWVIAATAPVITILPCVVAKVAKGAYRVVFMPHAGNTIGACALMQHTDSRLYELMCTPPPADSLDHAYMVAALRKMGRNSLIEVRMQYF